MECPRIFFVLQEFVDLCLYVKIFKPLVGRCRLVPLLSPAMPVVVCVTSFCNVKKSVTFPKLLTPAFSSSLSSSILRRMLVFAYRKPG